MVERSFIFGCALLSGPLLLGSVSAHGDSPEVVESKAYRIEGEVGVGSRYVYRGMSLGNRVSPSLGLTARHRSGWFAGFWAGRDDIAGLLGPSRDPDIETEYALGYQRVFNREWSGSVSRIWHEFLWDNQPRNHDYQETVLQLDHAKAGSFVLGHAHDVWTTGMNLTFLYYQHRSVHHLGDYEFYIVKEIGTNAFRRGDSNRNNTRLDYARLSAARAVGPDLMVQADYSYGRPSRANFFENDRVRSQWVLSLKKIF